MRLKEEEEEAQEILKLLRNSLCADEEQRRSKKKDSPCKGNTWRKQGRTASKEEVKRQVKGRTRREGKNISQA